MAMATQIVNVRVDAGLKKEVEAIFAEIGLTTPEAIRLFFTQVKRQRAIPFALVAKSDDKPNALTRKVIRDTDRGIGVSEFKTVKDMFSSLGL